MLAKENVRKMPREYTEYQILVKFMKLTPEKKIKILEKALQSRNTTRFAAGK